MVAGAQRAKAVAVALPETCRAQVLGHILLYIKSQVLRRIRWDVLDCSPKFSSLMLLSAIYWDLGFLKFTCYIELFFSVEPN